MGERGGDDMQQSSPARLELGTFYVDSYVACAAIIWLPGPNDCSTISIPGWGEIFIQSFTDI